MAHSFRLDYRTHHRPVPRPELCETYDALSAYYDFQAAGPACTLSVGDYTLELDGRLLINWMRESLPLAERIVANAPDDWAGLRDSLPALPEGALVYCWLVADIAYQPPVLVFVVDGAHVLIYTRSSASVGGPKLILLEGDREEPTIVTRASVVEVIAAGLTLYLDDLVAAFEFLREDEVYQSLRVRIAALLLAASATPTEDREN